MNLKSWLRRSPPATKLRFDGKRVYVVGQGKTKWVDAENAIAAYAPTLLEALNEDENVLRVTQLEPGGASDAPTEDPKNVSRDVELARIILEATDRGAMRHAEAYTLAFAENTKLVQILAERLGGLETAWQQSLIDKANAANAGDGTPDDPAEAAVLSMLNGAARRAAGGGGAKTPETKK
jgi:hypothetical protein